MTSSDAPDASCNLSEQELRARVGEIRAGIARRVQETRELPDGVAFRLPEAAESEAREFIAFEARCCGFAGFRLRRDDAAGALWLEVRGPAETARAFVAALSAPGETAAR